MTLKSYLSTRMDLEQGKVIHDVKWYSPASPPTSPVMS